jgi:hypothetical protein
MKPPITAPLWPHHTHVAEHDRSTHTGTRPHRILNLFLQIRTLLQEAAGGGKKTQIPCG